MVAPLKDSRLAPLNPPYDPAIARTLERMMGGGGVEPLKLFRTVAHNAAVLDKFRGVGTYLLNYGCVDAIDREILILRTCARCGSSYEWGVHVAVFAATVGLDDNQVAATLEDRSDVWTDRQATLIRLADELHDTANVTDDLWNDITRHFEPAQIVELLALAGQYRLVSYFTNALRVELEDFAPRMD